MTAVTIHWEAPAKVNLRLVVLAREASGFHQLETVFCAIDLADTITAQRAERGIELEVVGARLGEPQENLVWRAASAFFRASGIAGGARLRLDKRIPVGAGLGGGSSDAASTLHALNALYGRPLGPRSILELAAELGSDVPFFAAGRPFALAWGRGGRLLPFPALPPAPTVVGVPDFSIATVYAYGELARARYAQPATVPPTVLDLDALASWQGLAALAVNDFEDVIFQKYPILARAVRALADAGALISRLSGSGSAVFGIFPDEPTRDEAVARLRTELPRLRWVPCATVPEPVARAGNSLI